MDGRSSTCLLTVVILFTSLAGSSGMTKEEKSRLRLKVHEMFSHAYGHYMTNAYPADELMPLSCRGRYRGSEPSRGDIDDALGNFSLSLIDSLDTLVIMGDIDEFDDAVRRVISHVTFDTDVVVSVFETNIRVLGGLLGGHLMALHVKKTSNVMQWYRDELLQMATDLGHRLLPAFNTTTGMPFPRVNLRYGVKHERSRTGEEKDTCTACAGSMLLEFSALSRLTGDKVFEEKAARAVDYLWQSRHRASDLVGTVINIHNGDWVRRDSGVGAGIDSYYEYLLKAYIMLGDDIYLTRFNKHYKAIMKYISNGPLMLDVHMHKPQTNSKHFMDALLAFWPGLQVLKGDLKAAIEMHEMLYQIIQRHNFLPEAFTSDFRVHWAQHPLRPEFVESTYFIYKATGDPYYLDVGKSLIDNLDRLARVPCGFAAIKDVTTGVHEDQMDSFVLAETFKYLYLLFSEKEDLTVDVDDYVFTTEAHLLPLFLSSAVPASRNESSQATSSGDIVDHEDDFVCPSSTYLFKSNVDFAHHVRSPLKNMVEQLCPKPTNGIRPPRLRASDFIAGNAEHLDALARMGIKLITMNDGRVQLLHVSTEAASSEDSNDGMLFMQDMIELSKTQAHDTQEPRIVQLVSEPFLGTDVMRAGPAQFGLNLKNHQGIQAEVAVAEPFRACEPILNDDKLLNKIALFERGDCMFIDKARNVQAAGAVGGIVFDNNSHSSADLMPMFSMSGDGRSDVNIPVVFLFGTESRRLMDAVQQHENLVVYIGENAKHSSDILLEYLVTNRVAQPSATVSVDTGSSKKNSNTATSTNSVPRLEEESNVESDTPASVIPNGPDKSRGNKVSLSIKLNVDDLASQGSTFIETLSGTFDEHGTFTWQVTPSPAVSSNEDDGVKKDDAGELPVADSGTTADGSSQISSTNDLSTNVDSLTVKQTVSALLSQLGLGQLESFIHVPQSVQGNRGNGLLKVECRKTESSSAIECSATGRRKTSLRIIRAVDSQGQRSSDDPSEINDIFVTLLQLLQRCTNWDTLHETEMYIETLARLTEFVYSDGTMGYGVQTENVLSELAQRLVVSDACDGKGLTTETDEEFIKIDDTRTDTTNELNYIMRTKAETAFENSIANGEKVSAESLVDAPANEENDGNCDKEQSPRGLFVVDSAEDAPEALSKQEDCGRSGDRILNSDDTSVSGNGAEMLAIDNS